jgi:hypothetical protein
MDQRRLPLLALATALWVTVPATVPAWAQTLSEAEQQGRLAWQTSAGDDLSLPGLHSSAETAPSLSQQSAWAAAGLSLLLPGTGQFYAGAPSRGKVFLGVEAAIWTLAIIFDRRSAWKEDDAVDFAVSHAALIPEGKNDDFLEYLEFYVNRDEYNKAGRIIDPSRPYLSETRDTYWQWDSYGSQDAYRELRNSSESASRNRTFIFYAALANRLISAFDAYRVVHKNNARARDDDGLKLSVKPKLSLSNPGIMLNARLCF